MSGNRLAGIIVACTIVIVVAIVLVIVKPWEGPASAQTYWLTTAVNRPRTGSVSPSGGQYESGMQVTITAILATGYTLRYWAGDASGSTDTVTITMESDKTVTAYFTSVPPETSSYTAASGGIVYYPMPHVVFCGHNT